MSELGRAGTVVRGGADEDAFDHVSLDYEGRFLRRKRLTCDSGHSFHADLPETVSLDDGDAFQLDDGRLIGVSAAPEPLLRVSGDNLPRLAWHIGNRHTPCQIADDHVLIRTDRVLADMLQGLGAEVADVMGPFRPEGGAYGHGRTLGHSHGAAEGGAYQHDHHDHDHDHG